MLGKLEEEGHEIVDDLEDAEIVLVNTCAVKRTTLNRVIYRLKELRDKPDKKLVVGGCLPLIDYDKIEEIGGFEAVISCHATDSIGGIVERISDGEDEIIEIGGESAKLSTPRHRKSETSAPIPIAEGCLSDCAYCCVKFARGRLRSFKTSKIIKEVKNEIAASRREIYITAQDTAAYGMDRGTSLPELLKKIGSLPSKFRVRVGMMNPSNAQKIMPELLEAYDNEKIYKFLHLPIQSGNNKVLEDMNRSYTVEDFKDIVSAFREKFPDLYLATDIIVGFPGESEENFQESCDLIREIKPDKINLTRFTPMPDTKAKEMDQIESEEKKRRSKIMTSIHKEISHEKNKEYVGRETVVLVTKKGEKGGYMARLPNYKPVVIEEADPGDFAKIKITGAEPTYLFGEVLEVKK